VSTSFRVESPALEDNGLVSAVALTAPADLPARQAAPDVAVSLEHLSKRFAVRRTWRDIVSQPFTRTYAQALSDVTCTINSGEFFGILGPNGAGKTTLFKILATLVIPDRGRAVVYGSDAVKQVRDVRRQLVPVVADERSLRWRLNAWENLRLYAVLYRVPPAEVRQRIEEVLEIVGLASTGEKMTGQFSSGMKQRLLIARALLSRPRVLLLDEPTRGLDPLSARSLRAFLKDELVRKQGCTVVLATHNTEEAFQVCDRVGILDGGRLLTTGPAVRLAESFTDGRYQLWTRTPDHPALPGFAALGLIAEIAQRPDDGSGWSVLEMRVPGGADAAASVLERLVTSGVTITRFERVQLSLADLIERVQQRSAETSHA
jgi:ABC-2 type transport system ATP-binding protein